MRWITLALLMTCTLFTAEIDNKLYEGSQTEAYYQMIQEQIETAAKRNLYPKEIIDEEKLYLSRVRSAASQTIQIEDAPVKPFAKNIQIAPEQYYDVLSAAATLRLSLKERLDMLDDIHSKLIFSKRLIENLVEENKDKLLSYQLQHAYYRLQNKNVSARLGLLEAQDKQVLEILLQGLALLRCDRLASIAESLYSAGTTIEKIHQEIISLQIDLEKAMIEESSKVAAIKEKVESANEKYQKALRAKAVLQIQKALCLLQEKRNTDFFSLVRSLTIFIKDISKEERPFYEEQIGLLMELAKKEFGSTKLFLGSFLHESIELISNIKNSFSTPLFVYNEQPISMLSLIKVLIWISLGFFVGRLYKRWIARISKKWPDMSQMSVRLASNIGYYLIIFITLILAVGSLGINMTSISLIAGALSIGIGFGLQTVVSNLIAGIILMFERTIRIGDTIEISDLLKGRVTDMRIRSTTIKTFDNVDIVVPNSSFIQNNVINWTLEDPSRRLHIPFGVAYGTAVKDVIKAVLDELENSELTYIKDDKTKQPEIWMTAMNSSSVDFELLVWVEWDNKLRPNSFRSDFLILIYDALNKHGIQIPFPQLDLHVKHLPQQVLE